MTATSGPSVATVCVHCGGKEADAQTGRCLKCGKQAISPSILSEFGHPSLDRGTNVSRHSPSAAYRTNGSQVASCEASAATEPMSEQALPVPVLTLVPAPQPPEPETKTEPAALRAPERTDAELMLEHGVPTPNWLTQTSALRDGFAASAERKELEAKSAAAEAKHLRDLADELAYVLEQLGFEPKDEPTAESSASAPALTASAKPRAKRASS